jgi:cobalt-zinc-cadmium efflux system membrane fusion protein
MRQWIDKLKAFANSSFENGAIAAVIGATLVLSILIFTLSGRQSSGGGHGHGHGGGEHSEDEEEGGLSLDDDQLEASGVKIEEVGAQELKPAISLRGQIVENRNRSMIVRPRLAGLIKSAPKAIGETVKRGDVLATVESSTAGSVFDIRSAVNGVVVSKNAVVGAFVATSDVLFRVFDLSEVWFEADVPERDINQVRVGQKIRVSDQATGVSGEGDIFYVASTIDEDTQSFILRASLPNPEGQWRVGAFAQASVLLDTRQVELAVRRSALQSLEDKTVVFIRNEEELKPVTIVVGDADKEWVEVKGGLEAGQQYVAVNSFLIKAEILKSTAEHSH